MQLAYKAFYRLFDLLSYIHIPHDAGEFSLLDIKVVRHLLTFPERDMFFRGLRAFVGFKQVGIDYTRPERMFGRSTNSLFRNLNWAKKGLFSFSYTPLNILTTFSLGLFLVVLVLVVFQVASKLLFPESSPRGITTLLLVNLGFGSLILLAVSLLGEYIARIFEEVKRRPRFIRRSILRNGEIRKL
jgi:dolichol-phosphate mannosyltransferase